MDLQMKNQLKTNKVAGLDVQVLPVGMNGTARETVLPVQATVTAVRSSEKENSDFNLPLPPVNPVPVDAPEPRVVEVDGSTVAVAWHAVADVLSGALPVTDIATEALAGHQPFRLQRIAVYALVLRDGSILLTRISARGAHPGSWTLPGGGLDHGESPRAAVTREVREECGVACEVGDLLDVHDTHFEGTAPSGRFEDFHGVHLVFRGTVPDDARPRVVEIDGTTDDVAWVPVADVRSGRVHVLDVVTAALAAGGPGAAP